MKFHYRIPNANFGSLSIDTSLFPYDPLHQTFINIYEEGALRQQAIFNAESNARVYYGGTTQGAVEVMKTIGAINTIFAFSRRNCPLCVPVLPPPAQRRSPPRTARIIAPPNALSNERV